MNPPRSFRPSVAAVAVVSALTLLGTGAGIGYSAGQIGTKQIANNAITSKKVKNGSLKAKDLVKEMKQVKPVLGNGGEGDCLWQPGSVEVPGVAAPSYRKDRFGTVHLAGIAIAKNGPGGDAACNSQEPGEAEDGIVFRLPKGFMPADSIYRFTGFSIVVIAGPSGFTADGITIEPGGVWATDAALLDDISFEPAGSKVVVAKTATSGSGKRVGQLFR